MPHWIIQPWQRNLSKTASGKPGAVHMPFSSMPAQEWCGRCAMMVPGVLEAVCHAYAPSRDEALLQADKTHAQSKDSSLLREAYPHD